MTTAVATLLTEPKKPFWAKNPLTYIFHKTVGFTDNERNMLRAAMEYAMPAVNSFQFHERWLLQKLTSTKGLSNEEIYQKIMSGSTTVHPETDHDIDIHLEVFYSAKNTIGYTYPKSIWIWMNRRYLKNYDESDIAKNIFHEAIGHKMGFDHKSASEHTSVPYALGFLIRDMVREVKKYGRPLFAFEIPYAAKYGKLPLVPTEYYEGAA